MIIGGQSYVTSPPSFSSDGKRLLLCTGNTVSIFSTNTGLFVNELEGHTRRVTSVVVVPSQEVKLMCYCWTSSLDGTIRYWDFALGDMIRKLHLNLPIHSMVIPGVSSSLSESADKKSSLYSFISVEDTSKPAEQRKALRGRIQICDLSTSQQLGGFLTMTRKPEDITLSPSCEYLGIRNKRKIHIWKIPKRKFYFNDIKMIKLHHTKNFNVLAFHPTERMVAGGDTTGRILIWRGFGNRKFFGRKGMDDEEIVKKDDDDADSSPTTWHWHASEVKFLSFSSDGAYLYSGGKEGVIVVWQLETGKRKFKPRFGSSLLYFSQSPDISLCSVSCADNRVHLLKMPSMEIIKSIAGIQTPLQHQITNDELEKGLAYCLPSGLVALSAENYCVQVFSLWDNKELSQVQVCEKNYHPVEDTAVVITLVSLSVDCSLMGTVEIKLPEDGLGDLVCLKFWKCGSQAGDYTLSTIIYEPHSDAKISDLAFHPHNNMAASSSYGGDFKIWVCSLETVQNALIQKLGWRCQSVGSYKKHRMTASAFCADGSVLAIAAETVVTLWDPNTNVLVSVVGETLGPITKLSFVGKSEYLITLSQGQKPQLTAWNLSNLSISWCYKLHAEDISCKDDGLHFAVLALGSEQSDGSKCKEQDGFVLVFDVEKSTPIAIWSVKKAKGGMIAFIQENISQEQKVVDELESPTMLAYINCDHEYVLFDPLQEEKEVYHIERRARESNDLTEETGYFHLPYYLALDYYTHMKYAHLSFLRLAEWLGYASIYGMHPDSYKKVEEVPAISFAPSERLWETIFSGSSHILPPLTKLCTAFLESLLEKRSVTD